MLHSPPPPSAPPTPSPAWRYWPFFFSFSLFFLTYWPRLFCFWWSVGRVCSFFVDVMAPFLYLMTCWPLLFLRLVTYWPRLFFLWWHIGHGCSFFDDVMVPSFLWWRMAMSFPLSFFDDVPSFLSLMTYWPHLVSSSLLFCSVVDVLATSYFVSPFDDVLATSSFRFSL